MKIIGHRGAAGESFENSLSGILAALNAKVDGIEIDVQKTKDDEIIVFHDNFYDRLTNYKGLVKNIAHPKALDIKLKNHEQIPSLNEIIDLMKSRAFLFVEVKNEDSFDQTYKELNEKLLDQDFAIISFFHQGILDLKRKLPFVQTGIILEASPVDFSDYISRINSDYVILSIDTVTQQMVDQIKFQNRKLIFYGVNEFAEFRLASTYEPFGIVTNYPKKAQSYSKAVENTPNQYR